MGSFSCLVFESVVPKIRRHAALLWRGGMS
jgi:hypothetical protein